MVLKRSDSARELQITQVLTTHTNTKRIHCVPTCTTPSIDSAHWPADYHGSRTTVKQGCQLWSSGSSDVSPWTIPQATHQIPATSDDPPLQRHHVQERRARTGGAQQEVPRRETQRGLLGDDPDDLRKVRNDESQAEEDGEGHGKGVVRGTTEVGIRRGGMLVFRHHFQGRGGEGDCPRPPLVSHLSL